MIPLLKLLVLLLFFSSGSGKFVYSLLCVYSRSSVSVSVRNLMFISEAQNCRFSPLLFPDFYLLCYAIRSECRRWSSFAVHDSHIGSINFEEICIQNS